MIQYILDTDIITLAQRGHSVVGAHLGTRPANTVAITVISVEEQLSGWYTRLRRAKKRKELAETYSRFTNAIRFLSRVQLVTFSESAIIRFEALCKSHRGIGKNDLRIAAIALEHNAIVATRNVIDFQCIPGLQVEDWSQ